jgi:hypothetical protein
LKIATDGNIAGAAINLASMYQNGDGVPKDQEKYHYYINKAADLDSPIALRIKGLWYYDGDGVEKDYNKAFKYTLQAAKKSDPYAEANLAVMYLQGQGIEKNKRQALEWMKKTCNNPNKQPDQESVCNDSAILAVQIVLDENETIKNYLENTPQQ